MIPGEAVEAAAKAAYESTMEDGDTPWEHFGGSSYLDYYRAHARAALEAAAPHIRAEALLDAADDIALRGDIINKEKGGLDAWDYLIARAKTERTTK